MELIVPLALVALAIFLVHKVVGQNGVFHPYLKLVQGKTINRDKVFSQ